jgi:hypothetical protein
MDFDYFCKNVYNRTWNEKTYTPYWDLAIGSFVGVDGGL